MAVAIYNPKRGGIIRNFVWAHAKWNLGLNKIAKFPKEVGEALLRTYGFLVRVTAENIQDVKKQMKKGGFKCPYCDKEFDTRLALSSHVSKFHKVSEEEKEMIKGIGEAKPSSTYEGYKAPESKKIMPEDIEKKAGVTEKEGFYGPGLETDTLTDMKAKRPGETPGNFGG